jgi:hypothetical protein
MQDLCVRRALQVLHSSSPFCATIVTVVYQGGSPGRYGLHSRPITANDVPNVTGQAIASASLASSSRRRRSIEWLVGKSVR